MTLPNSRGTSADKNSDRRREEASGLHSSPSKLCFNFCEFAGNKFVASSCKDDILYAQGDSR